IVPHGGRRDTLTTGSLLASARGPSSAPMSIDLGEGFSMSHSKLTLIPHQPTTITLSFTPLSPEYHSTTFYLSVGDIVRGCECSGEGGMSVMEFVKVGDGRLLTTDDIGLFHGKPQAKMRKASVVSTSSVATSRRSSIVQNRRLSVSSQHGGSRMTHSSLSKPPSRSTVRSVGRSSFDVKASDLLHMLTVVRRQQKEQRWKDKVDYGEVQQPQSSQSQQTGASDTSYFPRLSHLLTPLLTIQNNMEINFGMTLVGKVSAHYVYLVNEGDLPCPFMCVLTHSALGGQSFGCREEVKGRQVRNNSSSNNAKVSTKITRAGRRARSPGLSVPQNKIIPDQNAFTITPRAGIVASRSYTILKIEFNPQNDLLAKTSIAIVEPQSRTEESALYLSRKRDEDEETIVKNEEKKLEALKEKELAQKAKELEEISSKLVSGEKGNSDAEIVSPEKHGDGTSTEKSQTSKVSSSLVEASHPEDKKLLDVIKASDSKDPFAVNLSLSSNGTTARSTISTATMSSISPSLDLHDYSDTSDLLSTLSLSFKGVGGTGILVASFFHETDTSARALVFGIVPTQIRTERRFSLTNRGSVPVTYAVSVNASWLVAIWEDPDTIPIHLPQELFSVTHSPLSQNWDGSSSEASSMILNPGGSVIISVQIQAQHEVEYEGMLTIKYVSQPHTPNIIIPLSATGGIVRVEADKKVIDFGRVCVGKEYKRVVNITNSGTIDLDVLPIWSIRGYCEIKHFRSHVNLSRKKRKLLWDEFPVEGEEEEEEEEEDDMKNIFQRQGLMGDLEQIEKDEKDAKKRIPRDGKGLWGKLQKIGSNRLKKARITRTGKELWKILRSVVLSIESRQQLDVMDRQELLKREKKALNIEKSEKLWSDGEKERHSAREKKRLLQEAKSDISKPVLPPLPIVSETNEVSAPISVSETESQSSKHNVSDYITFGLKKAMTRALLLKRLKSVVIGEEVEEETTAYLHAHPSFVALLVGKSMQISLTACFENPGVVEGNFVLHPSIFNAKNLQIPFTATVFTSGIDVDSLSPLSFGQVAIGESKTLIRKFTNTGTLSVSFNTNHRIQGLTVTPKRGSLKPGESVRIHFLFRSVAASVQSGHVVFSTPSHSPISLFVYGGGGVSHVICPSEFDCGEVFIGNIVTHSIVMSNSVSANVMINAISLEDNLGIDVDSLSPLSFGQVAIGESKTLIRKFTNTGTLSVSFNTNHRIQGLTVTPKRGSLKPGESVRLHFLFRSVAASVQSGHVVFSTPSHSPISLFVYGGGGVSHVICPSEFDCGEVFIGNIVTHSIVMSNSGSANVMINAISLEDNLSFRKAKGWPTLPINLEADSSLSIPIVFAPQGETIPPCQLLITTSSSLHVVLLRGSGRDALVSVTPSSLLLTAVHVGAVMFSNVDVTNSGDTGVQLRFLLTKDLYSDFSKLSLNDPAQKEIIAQLKEEQAEIEDSLFLKVQQISASLGPFEKKEVKIRFFPQKSVSFTLRLLVVSSFMCHEISVAIESAIVSFSMDQTIVDFGHLCVGDRTELQNINVYNSGTVKLPLILSGVKKPFHSPVFKRVVDPSQHEDFKIGVYAPLLNKHTLPSRHDVSIPGISEPLFRIGECTDVVTVKSEVPGMCHTLLLKVHISYPAILLVTDRYVVRSESIQRARKRSLGIDPDSPSGNDLMDPTRMLSDFKGRVIWPNDDIVDFGYVCLGESKEYECTLLNIGVIGTKWNVLPIKSLTISPLSGYLTPEASLLEYNDLQYDISDPSKASIRIKWKPIITGKFREAILFTCNAVCIRVVIEAECVFPEIEADKSLSLVHTKVLSTVVNIENPSTLMPKIARIPSGEQEKKSFRIKNMTPSRLRLSLSLSKSAIGFCFLHTPQISIPAFSSKRVFVAPLPLPSPPLEIEEKYEGEVIIKDSNGKVKLVALECLNYLTCLSFKDIHVSCGGVELGEEQIVALELISESGADLDVSVVIIEDIEQREEGEKDPESDSDENEEIVKVVPLIYHRLGCIVKSESSFTIPTMTSSMVLISILGEGALGNRKAIVQVEHRGFVCCECAITWSVVSYEFSELGRAIFDDCSCIIPHYMPPAPFSGYFSIGQPKIFEIDEEMDNPSESDDDIL
ncbi:hypothetical protein ADUPG1_011947, partial [Aduncisulcus paluster]